MAPLIYSRNATEQRCLFIILCHVFLSGSAKRRSGYRFRATKKLFTIFAAPTTAAWEKGLLPQIFLKDLKKFVPGETMIYACGPKPMLVALPNITKTKYPCQVSLEERMACGIGACLSCAVAVKRSKSHR